MEELKGYAFLIRSLVMAPLQLGWKEVLKRPGNIRFVAGETWHGIKHCVWVVRDKVYHAWRMPRSDEAFLRVVKEAPGKTAAWIGTLKKVAVDRNFFAIAQSCRNNR